MTADEKDAVEVPVADFAGPRLAGAADEVEQAAALQVGHDVALVEQRVGRHRLRGRGGDAGHEVSTFRKSATKRSASTEVITRVSGAGRTGSAQGSPSLVRISRARQE